MTQKFQTIGVLLLLVAGTARASHDEFLTDVYDKLHDSPMQRSFREKAPMPFGVVFLPWKGMTEQNVRHHFRLMKQLGFGNLKQIEGNAEWSAERLMNLALDEDIIPFWYGEAGWDDITPELVQRLGIPQGLSKEQIRQDPRMRAYQREYLRKQIPAAMVMRRVMQEKFEEFQYTPDPFLPVADVPYFEKWLRSAYKSPREVANAWNEGEIGIDRHPFTDWEGVNAAVRDLSSQPNTLRGYGGEYSRVRDVLRFKAETHAAQIRESFAEFHRQYPMVPTRTGGEMGLFLPFAWRATNMEDLAATQTDTGSFYPSIHLAWHFGEVHYEVARTVYMQASFANDLFKGGWAATWESTGGPQQLTGGKGWDYPEQSTTAGFTVNAGTISQLLLSYLAAGFKGAGIWAWNYREAGWEGGEYGLLNRQLEASDRAIRAGKIAQAARRYREELWHAHKEPLVGVLLNWDNDAIWAAVSLRGRDHFRHYPMQARVGVSRALINGNIPWEYVTVRDLERGLGGRYRVIYAPAELAISPHLLGLLADYVQRGGRIVMDSPGGDYDESGKVLNTKTGSAFEKLFGAELADLQYSSNVPRSIKQNQLAGFISELHPTTARTVAQFQTGEPAVLENRMGNGSAVLLAWDASFAVFQPGKPALEALLLKYALGPYSSPFKCDGAIVYRLAAPHADHYFFLNDDVAKTVTLDTRRYAYKSALDPVSGEEIELNAPIALESYSARWIRCQK